MDQDLTELNDQLAVLRKRWRVVASTALVGAVAGVSVVIAQPTRFTAEATVSVTLTAAGQPATVDPEQMTTLAKVALSDDVVRRARQKLPSPPSAADLVETTTVEPSAGTMILTITSTQPGARRAARVANAVARALVDHQARQGVARQQAVQDAYHEQLDALETELSDRRDAVERLSPGPARRDARAEVDSLSSRLADLQTEMVLGGRFAPDGLQADVLQKADPPAEPSQPKPLRGGLLGAVIGLVLGAVLASLRDRQDDVIRGTESLTALVPGAPLLGTVPPDRAGHRGAVTSLVDRASPASEAYRALTTNLRFVLRGRSRAVVGKADRAGHRGRVVMVSSAMEGEGKTSVATNVAVTAAGLGVRVVLVDGDLRSPAVAARFDLEPSLGLSDLLLGDGPITEHMQEVGVSDLLVLTAGTMPPNPTELLASARARQVWRGLRARADLVIVDAPPLLAVADALQLMNDVDDVVLVVREGHTRARQLRAALQRVRPAGEVTGIVLNDVRDKFLRGGDAVYGTPAAYRGEADARDG